MVKKTVHKYVKQLKEQLRKVKFKPTRPVAIILAVVFFLVLTGGVAAFSFREKIASTILPKSPLTFTLLQPNNTQEKIVTATNIEVAVSIQTGDAPLQEKETALKVLTKVDGNTVHESEVKVAENSEVKHTFSLPTESLTEGEHTVEVSLVDTQQNTKTLDQKTFSFVKDTVKPTITELTSAKSNTAQLSLRADTQQSTTTKTASSSATASASAEKKNVYIFDTKPSAVQFTLTFSEPGKFSITPPEPAQVTWDQNPTTQPNISIPANQKPFTAPYRFSDHSGLALEGTISYTYDNAPPQITLKSTTEMTNKWGSSYAVMFVTNEPITSSFVEFAGQKLEAKLNSMKYYVATIKLNMGDNPFSITATDKHGNTGSKNFSVKLTQDPEPVYWAGNPKPFKRCTDEDFSYCREKTGGVEGWGGDCDKFNQYKSCIKSRCDNTVAYNLCP